MRLPFLQVASDLLAHGVDSVAALLGCSAVEALGHIAFLQAWAVSRSPDDAAPDGLVPGANAAVLVAAGARWKGEPAKLVAALSDPGVGLLAVEAEGLRVLKLEPYRRAWESQNKERKRKEEWRKSRDADGTRTRRGHSGDGDRQTQTQTQTQKGETTPPARDPAGASGLGEDIAAVMRATDPTWAWDAAKEHVLRALLGKGAPAEVLRRLGVARARTRFPLFTSLGDLVKHWDAYAQPEPASAGPPSKPPRRDLNPNDYQEGPVTRL